MIYLASDHRGFELKQQIRDWLSEWGMEYEDLGPDKLDPEDDYPDFVARAAEKVSADPSSRAIVLGHSGQGEGAVANKFRGVRAVVYYGGPDELLTLSRQHNDANVLSLGASFVDPKKIKQQTKLWLETDFTGEERHRRRIEKIGEIENR